ncbi:hypothetical protein [Paraburkholderia sediminicola]|uniref:hypothetical protein n=1 Tax=Paraburkholderia sediminicola TaxID=458836 RepID=UPI0038B8EEE3
MKNTAGGAQTGGKAPVFTGASSNTQAPVTGTTALTLLKTLSLPAGALLQNGSLESDCLLSFNNSAGTKTFTITVNGVTVQQLSFTTQLSARIGMVLRNRNSLSSQVAPPAGGSGATGGSGAAPSTYTIDTSQALTINYYAQLQTGTDNAAVEYANVKVANA